jgi:hypothetical protein
MEVNMAKKTESVVGKFDLFKTGVEDLSDILSAAENGKANPIKLSDRLNESFAGQLGGNVDQDNLYGLTQHWHNHLVKSVVDYNNALQEMSGMPRIYQDLAKPLAELQEGIGAIKGAYLHEKNMGAIAKDVGYKGLSKDEKATAKKVSMGNSITNALLESYMK